MPPRTRTRTTAAELEERLALAETEQAPDADETGEYDPEQRYVVLVDALTVSAKGRRRGEISSSRYVKGESIVLNDDLNDIDNLLRLKAISIDDGAAKRRTSPAVLAHASGGRDDKVKARYPVNLFDVTATDMTVDDDDRVVEAAHHASDAVLIDEVDDEGEYTGSPAQDDE